MKRVLLIICAILVYGISNFECQASTENFAMWSARLLFAPLGVFNYESPLSKQKKKTLIKSLEKEKVPFQIMEDLGIDGILIQPEIKKDTNKLVIILQELCSNFQDFNWNHPLLHTFRSKSGSNDQVKFLKSRGCYPLSMDAGLLGLLRFATDFQGFPVVQEAQCIARNTGCPVLVLNYPRMDVRNSRSNKFMQIRHETSEQIKLVLEKLNVDKKNVVLIGNNFGGYLAPILAQDLGINSVFSDRAFHSFSEVSRQYKYAFKGVPHLMFMMLVDCSDWQVDDVDKMLKNAKHHEHSFSLGDKVIPFKSSLHYKLVGDDSNADSIAAAALPFTDVERMASLTNKLALDSSGNTIDCKKMGHELVPLLLKNDNFLLCAKNIDVVNGNTIIQFVDTGKIKMHDVNSCFCACRRCGKSLLEIKCDFILSS